MKNTDGMKLLYIIVNMGFGSSVVEIAHEKGVVGAVIMKATGITGMARETLLGIPVEVEKEIVLTIAKEGTAQEIMETIKENAGVDSPAHGICLALPIDALTPLNIVLPQAGK